MIDFCEDDLDGVNHALGSGGTSIYGCNFLDDLDATVVAVVEV